MKPKIATVTGTFLTPGVSTNDRLYTRENIGRAVARMNQRLKTGGPIVMRPWHPENRARFDATKIAGRVTKVEQADDGSGLYEAEIPDTAAGRDIVALTASSNGGKPFLANTSIYGYWATEPRTIEVDGRPVETADDLEVDAIDFTPHPGVAGAKIVSVTLAETAAELAAAPDGRKVILETSEATITPRPETPKAPIVEINDRTITVTLTEDQEPADAARQISEALAGPNLSPEHKPGAVTERKPPVADETKAPEGAALQESINKAVTEALAAADKARSDAKAAKKAAKAAKEAEKNSKPAVTETATESKGLSEKKVNSIVEAAVTAAVTKAVAETKDAFREEIAKGTGAPRRKGLIESAQKSLEKAPHEMSPEEWAEYRGQATALALTTAPERTWGDLAPAR